MHSNVCRCTNSRESEGKPINMRYTQQEQAREASPKKGEISALAQGMEELKYPDGVT